MKRVIKFVDVNFEPTVMAVLFYAMTTLIAVQVVLRFFFQAGFSWAEEIARILFVWLMYFSFSYATRNHRHIGVGFVKGMFPEKIQKVILLLVDILFFFFTTAALIAAISIIEKTARYNDRAQSIDISMNVLYAAAFIGYGLMGLRLLQGFVWKSLHFKDSLEVYTDENGVYSGANEIFFYPKEKISLVKDEEPSDTTFGKEDD